MHAESNDARAYEQYIGRWSRVVAEEFVAWLAVPPKASWLDIACGTGGLTETIASLCDPGKIDACDMSAARVAYARETIRNPLVAFHVADASALPFDDDRYDAVVSGLPFPSVRDPSRALQEFARVAKSGGVVGLYVWDLYGEMDVLRCFWESATALDPDADEDDTGARFTLCAAQPLGAALRTAGLRNVEVRAIDAVASFRNFDDYWMPFLRGTSPAQSHVQSLPEERRAELREHLRKALPIAPDGSIRLRARAWAARGFK